MSSLVSNASKAFGFLTLFILSLFLFPCTTAWGQDSLSLRPPDYLLARARESLSGKHFPESILYYKGYLQQHPLDDDVRTEMARTLSWNTEYDSALTNYSIVLARNEKNFDAGFGKCQVLGWKQEYPEAIREVDRLLQLYPRNIELLLLAGTLYLANNNFDSSLEMNQRVLSLESGNQDALLGRCRALQGLGRTDQAYAEIQSARLRFPENNAIEQLYVALQPKPRNQFFVRYQNENFDVKNRSDHRTVQAQYYRVIKSGLTVYAEMDAYRRFDQNDQSIGAGAYYTISRQESLFGYCLVSPDPTVTSIVDASVEYNREVEGSFSVYLAYRLLDFKTETAHIVSPGFSWTILRGIELRERIYISRTVQAKTTSRALSIQCSYAGLTDLTPYVYYAVGNEAYRGVTLDNIESSDSWSVTIGGKYAITGGIVLRADYQYLNRIGYFHENSLDVGVGYYW